MSRRWMVCAYRWAQDRLLPERAIVRGFIERQLPLHFEGRRCLGFDLGAGTAPYSPTLQRAAPGLRVLAVDITATDRVAVLADAERLPFGDGVADLVAAFHLLQHATDPRLCLAEARRILRNDGLLLIAYPSLGGAGRSRDLWRWTRAGMEVELHRAGFDVLAHEARGGLMLLTTSLVAAVPGRLLVRHRRGWHSGRGAMDAVRLAGAFALALPFHLLGFAAFALDRIGSSDPAHSVGGTVLARRRRDA